ncbi:hypothetical protein [Metabacillus halosaccharovorans]|uniref:hypothetical protein n=1 Tax=Metabacillus halosaccharovorans TaxID=930124 RepID=UPI0020400D63|nr:hypothetical protein [Metabacillus halosaccharovorans]MCM3444380.1 hypothetical protein [Metabacillus halosaccharovorans]
MTLTELVQILKATGYPVAYSHFKVTSTNPAPNPPFIVYMVEGSSNLFADNKTYQKINDVRIELYTDIKDLEAEGKIESLLDEHEIPYETDEIWIESQQLFQKNYNIGVI